MRYDTYGNRITTEIGTFRSRRNGGGKVKYPKKTAEEKAKRHRISFADDILGDKDKISQVHYIESYKKMD